MIVLIKILLLSFIYITNAAPVRKDTEKPPETNLFNDLHYRSYLEEVVKELEKDKAFSERIKEAQEHNRTAHIAQSLQFVNHQIRNKLDEIKRREIERLNILENELIRKRMELSGAKVPPPNASLGKIIAVDKNHIDHSNAHTFEIDDLEKLIKKTEEDLLMVDKEQDEQYKEHEMKKSYLKKKKLETAKDDEERKKLEKDFSESEKRHKDHPKVHQPGNEEQLKEVWDKTDHLDPNEFNPLSFFNMHDINGDGHLDFDEIEAIMQTELSKVYEANNTDDDIQERFHEMMRMRQAMLKSMDGNKDDRISKDEFLKYSSSLNFKDDPEWKTQEEENQKPYTDDEYKQFEDTYGRSEDDDDDFSDQDDSLRYIPKNMGLSKPPVNAEEHKPDQVRVEPAQSSEPIVKTVETHKEPPKL